MEVGEESSHQLVCCWAGDDNEGELVEDKKSRNYRPEYLYGVPIGFPRRKCFQVLTDDKKG